MLDVFGFIVIGISILIWWVAMKLNHVDPSYFRTRDGRLHWWDPQSVFGVVGMIFDWRLPNPSHGSTLRRDIITIRVLYAFAIVGGALFMFLIFTQPALVFAR
ncbi:hypothetical protein DVJ77_19470 [Dyella tabacisoli]|uniref:Uncharacterized protein n=2 Tax=Dyella tabacisoli TaxID=2282381 RepID=A0A369UI83_9GAMM|nr:hypothetical protein DVJ77_19470 [Dyella tabacisoli]